MTEDTQDRDEYVARVARAVGMPIPAEIHPLVVGHFEILAGHAAKVMAAEISDEDEPAPVFTP